MPGPQVDALVQRILQALPRFASIDGAVEYVREELDTLLPGWSSTHAAEIEEARTAVARQFEKIEILHTHSVIRRRTPWYFGPAPGGKHWPALRGYLLNEKKWALKDVNAIDEASNEIVSLLENPRDPTKVQFSCRGLVVGHVQAGKTASMTAVIAKALDAGYDTVIVLAGLTNKLRLQTQMRLFEDLVRRNPLHWHVHTPNQLDGDFRAPAQGGFLAHVDKAQLAVVKKNSSPLRQLKIAIEETLPTVLRNLRILVIDDECDQASVNAAKGELDMTTINQNIREILAALPAATYVGYTATPFANVLINPYKGDGQTLDDLYPRDFITALPTSDNYFGTERLFGRMLADPEDHKPGDEGLDMIRSIPEEDEEALQPGSTKDRHAFVPRMTATLETAILYFLTCCAARRARGDVDQHMTMLVHTSAFINVHERVASMISNWVIENAESIVDRTSAVGQRIESIWRDETVRVPPLITRARDVSIHDVFQHLPTLLDKLEFPVENGASEDRIDYSGVPRTYIVVGGSILARGLTLEGLMVSYFLRTANQYDTLLQMGRWFGYRRGYEDLPRIWMPDHLKLKFRALAVVEAEIREEIEQYRLQNLTPMDIAVRIRSIPGMAITGATKMRAAQQASISYWGTHRQTFRFAHKDSALLERNWDAGGALIREADAEGSRGEGWERRKLWRGVPKASVSEFLRHYRVDKSHADLAPELLLKFLDQDDPRLSHWNIGIVESAQGDYSEREFGPIGRVRTVRRAKLKGEGEVADIKALMSKRDILFDCNPPLPDTGSWAEFKEFRSANTGHIPLLLLYPIHRISEPERKSTERTSLDAVRDVLGLGIVFPGSTSEGGNYVSVMLQPLSADEIAEIEAEEAAQAEAAGVN